MIAQNLSALSAKLILLATTTNEEEKQQLKKEIAELTQQEQDRDQKERFLKFTEKEISKMPKQFRKIFRTQGKTVHYRERKDGRYKKSYEARYAKRPFNNPPISVSATTLEELKTRFIEKLNNYVTHEDNAPIIPKDFHEFAMYWFENFHKAIVVPKTFSNNLSLYNRHIKEKLCGYTVSSITPIMLKNLIDNLPGNGKTADDVHGILNQIFKTAGTHGLIKVNPLGLFVHIPHERESGTELTIKEELLLFEKSKGTVYEIMFALMLYAGLRPNEVKTVKIENNFVVSINSKRKKGKIEYKKIPIISYLCNHLDNSTSLEFRTEQSARDFFNTILPHHTLKDLRKTFNTKCVSCKVDFYAKEKFMGHSIGKLDKTYTGNIDDYLQAEAKKLENWYAIPQKYPKK